MLCAWLVVLGVTSCSRIETGVITGRVVASTKTEGAPAEEDTPSPIAILGATCLLEGTQKNTVTNETGHFRFQGLAGGLYVLHCKHTTPEGTFARLLIVDVPSTTQGGGIVAVGDLELARTGSLKGTATLLNQPDSTGITVHILGSTSLSTQTDAQGEWHLRDVAAGTHAVRFEKDGYLPVTVQDVALQPQEEVRLEAQTLQPSTLDAPRIRINNGAATTPSRTVEVSLEGVGNASHYLLSEDIEFTGATWRELTATTPWTFTLDGPRTLHARFSQGQSQGPSGPTVKAAILVDTTPPENARVLVNNGASRVSSSDVVLTLSATDRDSLVSEMKVGHDPALTTSAWEPFKRTRAWTLSTQTAPIRVYAKFRDTLGNEIPDAVSATVTVGEGTQVSGILASDTRWTLARSPYVVTGDVLVPDGRTLTIEPGVQVLFRGRFTLTIQGGLFARGTPEAPILLGSDAPSPGPGDWQGLVFEGTSVDAVLDGAGEYLSGSVLEHTEVRHSAAGISIVDSAPLVSRNHIHHHGTGSAALMLERSRSLVRDNLIEHNTTRQALFIYACDSRLIRNTIQDNIIGLVLHANDVLRCPDGAAPATVERNQFLRNSSSALQVLSGDAQLRHNTIRGNFRNTGPEWVGSGTAMSISMGTVALENNLITDNRGPPGRSSAISIYSGSVQARLNTFMNLTNQEVLLDGPASQLTVSASENYWGPLDEPAVRARIWDAEDNPSYPRVSITPLLPSPHPDTGVN